MNLRKKSWLNYSSCLSRASCVRSQPKLSLNWCYRVTSGDHNSAGGYHLNGVPFNPPSFSRPILFLVSISLFQFDWFSIRKVHGLVCLFFSTRVCLHRTETNSSFSLRYFKHAGGLRHLAVADPTRLT